MKTTPQSAFSRKTYPEEVKHQALQYLKNGQSLQDVSLELGVAPTALLRWRRNAGLNTLPTKPRFDADFKARALQKLDGGQSLRQVGPNMGVSISTLLQWKRQRQENAQQPAPTCPGPDVNRGSQYADSFNGIVQQVMENGQPPGLVTNTSGVVGTTLPRWKNQADAPNLLTTGDSSAPGYIDETKEKALGLLESGKSITQVSMSLGISNVVVRRWWLRQNISGDSDKVDGRRLYDDAFKAEALRQIHRGVSIRQLAKSLGVTEVTLHKWRKKVSFPNELVTSEPYTSTEPSVERIAHLEQQLRKVEQERDTLKKAIQILMRAS
jgi:transposase